jgi:quercetin dioxygenase-like cupin family protein
MTFKPFVHNSEIEPVEMRPGVLRRTLAISESMMVCEVVLLEGSLVPAHQHIHEQTGYIVSGQVEFTIGDQTTTLYPGDSYAVPSNVVHSVIPLVASVVIDVFSPPRDEFRIS